MKEKRRHLIRIFGIKRSWLGLREERELLWVPKEKEREQMAEDEFEGDGERGPCWQFPSAIPMAAS